MKKIYIFYITVFLALAVGPTLFKKYNNPITPSSFSSFETELMGNNIKDIVIINRENVLYEDGTGTTYSFNMPSDIFNEEVNNIYNLNPEVNKIYPEYISKTSGQGTNLLVQFLPVLLLIGFFYFMYNRNRGGSGLGKGMGSPLGKKDAITPEEIKDVNFNSVAGLDEAKEEITEIVDFLKNSDKYKELGARIPKGLLLEGPPGTGKTLLAKAVAGEANVPFYSMSGSDFVEMFVGVGASRVRELFETAKKSSPSIVFIDEIDAIGKARGNGKGMSNNQEQENTLNALLTEMDGFGTDQTVIVIAATNRADMLDKALVRAGRFDRTINVGLPELNDRKAIFEVHLAKIKKAKSIDIDLLAKQTPGFSGAYIANVVNEAALLAARRNRKTVWKKDFSDAIDRIVAGLEKKSKIVKPEERRKIAFHEAGHALVSSLCEYASPLVKVTITPRGRSLGAAWYLPEERQLSTPKEMLDEMCATLAGRAAEKVIFDEISTGALSDLEKANKTARNMVTIYGLDEELLNISYYGRDDQFNKPHSEKVAQIIDERISNIINKQYTRALKLVEDNRDKLTSIAELLLEKESIQRKDVDKIIEG